MFSTRRHQIGKITVCIPTFQIASAQIETTVEAALCDHFGQAQN